MKILVTGADGCVGSWLVSKLLEGGHEVAGGVRPDGQLGPSEVRRTLPSEVRSVPFELCDGDSVRAAMREGWDAVVQLAAVSSGSEAGQYPMAAWEANALGTARVAHELGTLKQTEGLNPVLLVVSSAEVYGAGHTTPIPETEPPQPCSVYGASKLAGEVAALEVWRRTGLRVIVARAFPHSGPGQDQRFVVPAFVWRLQLAKQIDAPAVKVGNLEPVREFMHVADVTEAYSRLIVRGEPGHTYNVASGQGISIRDLFFKIADALQMNAIPEVDPQLVRPTAIEYLVGDGTRLRTATGWRPSVTVDDMIRDVVDAQTS